MTTDIVPFHPPHHATQTSLELAPSAWTLACRIAGTEFVPKQLRGKPEAVLACILAGHEAGISPIQSLSKIHIVDGRPAMAAELMRALVLRAGHDIWIAESTDTRCTMKGSRAGSSRESSVTWTLDDAKRAKLEGKDNWRNYPRAMLTARATAELCRAIFPDVLAGISHTIEELADGDVIDADLVGLSRTPEAPQSPTADPPTTTAKADKVATRGATPPDPERLEAPPEPNRGETPLLPGEDDIVDAEIVDVSDSARLNETPETGSPPSDELEEWAGDPDPPPPDAGPRLTGPQVVNIRLEALGLTDRDDRLRAISAIVDRPISTSNDLTPAEITTVLETVDQLPEGASLLPGPDPAPPPAPSSASPPGRGRRATVTPPEEWTGARWREFLKSRKIPVGVAIKQAQSIGAEQDPPVRVALLDDLAGSGIAADLIGWVEERTT